MSDIDSSVTIQLDRKRHLRLTLNAMIAFKKETGKELLAGLKAEKMTLEDVRAFIWACLIHEDKDLTIEDVGNMVHAGNLAQVTDAIAKAWEAAMPEAGKDPLAKSPHSR